MDQILMVTEEAVKIEESGLSAGALFGIIFGSIVLFTVILASTVGFFVNSEAHGGVSRYITWLKCERLRGKNERKQAKLQALEKEIQFLQKEKTLYEERRKLLIEKRKRESLEKESSVNW